MCEDDGTRGGDGTAEVACCCIKYGKRWVVPVVPLGGQWMIKWGKVMRKIPGKLTSAWEEAERR